MDYKYLLYDTAEAIAKITVNRPNARNAISYRVYEELDDAFTRADNNKDVRVIIVAGSGTDFGAGHDLGSPEQVEEQKQNPLDMTPAGFVDRMYHYYWHMRDHQRNLSKPTIAMVQGWCIMGSWMLASACDLIVVSEDARFVDWANRRGRPTAEYSTLFWDIGIRKAKEHLWTGEYIDGKEAWRLGMVNRVVPRDQLEKATMDLAKKIALNDPLPVRLSKISMNQAADIMGQTAAMKATFHMWGLARAFTATTKPDNVETQVGRAKAKEQKTRETES